MSEQNVIHGDFGKNVNSSGEDVAELLNITEHPGWRDLTFSGEYRESKENVPALYYVPGIDPETALYAFRVGVRQVLSRMSGRD